MYKVADIQEVLLQSAQVIRELVAENVELQMEKDASVQRERAERILAEAEAKGLDLQPIVGDVTEHQEKLAALLDDDVDLDRLDGAVKIAAGDMGWASVGDDPGVSTGDAAEARFMSVILD